MYLTLPTTPAAPLDDTALGIAKSLRFRFRTVRNVRVETTPATPPTLTREARVDVTLHQTRIARIALAADGRLLSVVIDAGGWRTLVTKARINDVLAVVGARVRLASDRGRWFLVPPPERGLSDALPPNVPPGARLPFVDGVDVAPWIAT